MNILQGKENLFVAMPSYKTKQTDENGKTKYQEICYPVTKEFRDKLYKEIISTYEWELQQQKRNNNSQRGGQSKEGRQNSYSGKISFC